MRIDHHSPRPFRSGTPASCTSMVGRRRWLLHCTSVETGRGLVCIGGVHPRRPPIGYQKIHHYPNTMALESVLATNHFLSNPAVDASGAPSPATSSQLQLNLSRPLGACTNNDIASLWTLSVAASTSTRFHRFPSGALSFRHPRQHKLEQHDAVPHIGQLIVPDPAYISCSRVIFILAQGPSMRGEQS